MLGCIAQLAGHRQRFSENVGFEDSSPRFGTAATLRLRPRTQLSICRADSSRIGVFAVPTCVAQLANLAGGGGARLPCDTAERDVDVVCRPVSHRHVWSCCRVFPVCFGSCEPWRAGDDDATRDAADVHRSWRSTQAVVLAWVR